MRQLTKKFGTYTLGKYEKATGKGVMDLLDVGNLEVNKIVNLIKLGNSDIKEEEDAYKLLDDYLANDEEHSLISAFFDLIDELDRDLKIMRSCGVKVTDIKEQFKKEVENSVKDISLKNKETLIEHVENEDDTLKEESETAETVESKGLTVVK